MGHQCILERNVHICMAPGFCSCCQRTHPLVTWLCGQWGLNSRLQRTVANKETLLNQLFPHSSVPKKQTEMPIYQSFLFFNIYSFIYFLAESGLSCGMRDLSLWRTGSSLQCVSFSLVVARGLWSAWALQSWHVGSLVLVRRLSCPAACGILVLWPGIEPASPGLQDGFLTTGPPGKSLPVFSERGLLAYLKNCYLRVRLII